MIQPIEHLREQNRIRLIALALEHLQLEGIASATIPIPGGDRVIAIGTPAQVRALLAGDHSMLQADVHEPSWQNGYSRGYTDGLGDARAALARAPLPGSDQVDSEGGHHD
jgi:hypothetical protein